MSTRIGIELSPTACRIVVIEAPHRRSAGAGTQVRSFSVSPRPGADTRAQLARLRGRQAAVVAWGLRGDHRQAIVGAGPYDATRREAIDSLRYAGIDTRGVLSDIAPAGPRSARAARRPVVMALAARCDVDGAVRPLVAAGIRIRSVVTPAAALCSLARQPPTGTSPAGIEAYVALEETATCIALVREHVLVAARELPWGYLHEHDPFGERVTRDQIAGRLADDLEEFFSTAGIGPGGVSVVCVCGGLSELRSMTASMMERLDAEIEPMDSMFGIDTRRLPEPSDEFRDRGVELRLAWAAAADWTAPLNLVRDRQRQATAAAFARAAVVAGIGAGLSLGWGLQRSIQWDVRVRNRPATRIASVAHDLNAMTTVAPRPVPTSGVPMSRPSPVVATVEPVAVRHVEPLPVPRSGDQPAPRPPARVAVRRPIPSAQPVEALPSPFATGARDRTPQAAGSVVAAALPVSKRSVAPPGRVPIARARRQEPPVRHTAAVDTILFGPDRRLAMIDGLIVETGDDVGGARVVEISPTSVVLRDETGRLSRLFLGSRAR